MRRGACTAGLLVMLAVCATDGEPSGPAADSDDSATGTVELPQVESSPREDVPSALDNMGHADLPEPLIAPADIVSGGPPPDGIPAIDEPRFQRVGDVDWLADAEAVLSVTVEGETRGYPVQILTWHEIVNDTIAGVPVAATYCPLCNSGVAFDRRVGDRVLDFGTSGRLYASNLVMYDRQTESLWPQLTGEASVGVLTGATLDSIPMIPVAWQDFREAHPDAWVLSRDTGHDRPYGQNPYPDYDDPDTGLLFDPRTGDDRLEPKERIVAITHRSNAVAVLRSAVADAGVLTITVSGREVVVFHLEGQASALDAGSVSGGAEIGSVAVFEPVVERQRLSFRADAGHFTDTQTGSTWNIFGRAVDGPLSGEMLPAQPFTDTFWFAWVAFQPETRVIPDAG
jgi:Protein of unknown function (DUF3179)